MIPARTQTNPFAPRRYGELQKISDRVYIFRNITNSSFVIGDRGVAVIDTQVNRPSAEQLLKAVRSVTDKPIQAVINTHYHWDHTNGNQLFKDQGAVVVASALTKEFMTRRAGRQKEFLAGRGFELGRDPLLPEVTFEREYLLDLGGMPLRLFFAGTAETDDATAVHIVRENIIASGDTVMTGSFPIFGQPVWDEGLQGDGQWQETLARLTALKPAHIIPGHGPLAHEAEVGLLLKIQRYFVDEVGARWRDGHSLERTLADVESRLPDWIRCIPLVWGTPRYAILRVYRGLSRKAGDEPGWQKYKPNAIPSADPVRVDAMTRDVEIFDEFLSMAREAKEGGDAGLRLAILRKARQVFGDLPEVLTSYAEALVEESRSEASVLEKGDFFHEARQCWDKVLAADAKHVAALLGKGRYLTMMAYRGGDDPRAGMGLLRKIIDMNGGGRPQAEAEFYLGMGYRRLSDEPQALSQFKKALEIDPTFTLAQLAPL